MSKKRILLVDDNAIMRREVSSLFASIPTSKYAAKRSTGAMP